MISKLLTKGAKAALTKAEKAKIAREAVKQKALRKNQKKPINKLEGMTSADKKAAGIGEASPARVMMGEASKKRTGLIADYKRTLKQVEENKNLTDEQLERMMNKLDDMRSKLKDAGVSVADLNKGGMPKKKKKVPAIAISIGMVEVPKGKGKAKMMGGGMANKKEHMYSAGGSVTDKLNPGLRALQKERPDVVAKILKKS